MAEIVMLYGESGSGKSTSLRNFSDDEVFIVDVIKKPLPFRKQFSNVLQSDDMERIKRYIRATECPVIVIDDATYLMTGEFMRTAKNTQFQKYTDMALNFYNFVTFCRDVLEPWKIVYIIGLVQRTDDGFERFKTIGKMIDEKIVLEGLFTIVLKTVVSDRQYYFATQTNGQDTVKSPIGMFDRINIANDLKAVDDAVRGYWQIKAPCAPKSNGAAFVPQGEKN